MSSPLGLSHDFEPSQIDHLALARLFDLPQNHPYTRTLLVLDLSRHLCITAAADTVARRERFRGLHALPADVLLALARTAEDGAHLGLLFWSNL